MYARCVVDTMGFALTPAGARHLFCVGMGLIYLAAFTSLYVQLPGLFAFDGLEPAHAFMDRVAGNVLGGSHATSGSTAVSLQLFQRLPTLLWFRHEVGLDVDTAMDACCLLGIGVSVLVAAGYGCTLLFTVSALVGACDKCMEHGRVPVVVLRECSDAATHCCRCAAVSDDACRNLSSRWCAR